MTKTQMKSNLIRTIDKLNSHDLNELTGIVSNYLQGKYGSYHETDEPLGFEELLLEAKRSIRSNGGTPHTEAMTEFRNRVNG